MKGFHRVKIFCTKPIFLADNTVPRALEMESDAKIEHFVPPLVLGANTSTMCMKISPDISYFISTDFDRNQLL